MPENVFTRYQQEQKPTVFTWYADQLEKQRAKEEAASAGIAVPDGFEPFSFDQPVERPSWMEVQPDKPQSTSTPLGREIARLGAPPEKRPDFGDDAPSAHQWSGAQKYEWVNIAKNIEAHIEDRRARRDRREQRRASGKLTVFDTYAEQKRGEYKPDTPLLGQVAEGVGKITRRKPIESFESIPTMDWKGMGPIGATEEFSRTTTVAPYSPNDLVDIGSVYAAVKRLEQSADRDYQGRDDDLDLVETYSLRQIEEGVRGKTVGAEVTRGLVELPKWMAEFWLTGPGAAIGKKAGRKAALASVGRVTRGATRRAIARLTGWTASGLARTAQLPHKIGEEYVRNRLPAGMHVDDDGNLIITEGGDGEVTAFLRALGGVTVEAMSESAGEVITKGVSRGVSRGLERLFINNPKARQVLRKIGDGIRKAKPGSAARLASQVGYNGIIGELGEERLADIMRAAIGASPSLRGMGLVERFVNSVPNARQLLVESIVLGVPGAGQLGLGVGNTAVNARRAYNQSISRATDRLGSRVVQQGDEIRNAARQGRREVPVPGAGAVEPQSVPEIAQAGVPRDVQDQEQVDVLPNVFEDTAGEAAAKPEKLDAEPSKLAAEPDKQPWEMTREEFIAAKGDAELAKGPFPAVQPYILGREWAAGVQRAVAEGKRPSAAIFKASIDEFGGMEQADIPPAVLQDYAGEPWADAALAKLAAPTETISPEAGERSAPPVAESATTVTPPPGRQKAAQSAANKSGAPVYLSQTPKGHWSVTKLPPKGREYVTVEPEGTQPIAQTAAAPAPRVTEAARSEQQEATAQAPEGGTVAEQTPEPGYGESNTLVTREAYEAAKKRFGQQKLYANPLDPERIADLGRMALYHFEALSRKTGKWVAARYTAWAESMKGELGDGIEPYLRTVWLRTRKQRQQLTLTARNEQKAAAVAARPQTTRQAVRENALRPRTTDQRILDFRLKQEQRAANRAYRMGQEDLAQAHEELTAIAQDTLLPSQQPAVQQAISRARTPQQLARLASRIELLANQNAINNRGPERVISENDLLKYAMQKAQQASAAGYLQGGKDVAAAHDDLLQYAKERGLSSREIGRIAGAIAKARTPAQRTRAAASIDILVEHERRQSALRDYRKARANLDLNHLRPKERRAAEALLNSISDRTPKAKMLERLKSLQRFLMRGEDGAPPATLLDKMREALDRDGAVPLMKLPPESIRQVANALREIAHLSAMKNKLIFSRKYATRQQAIDRATSEVEDYNPPSGKQVDPGKWVKRSWQNAFGRIATWAQLSYDTMTELLAGAKSTVRDLLYDALVRGEDLFARTHHAAIDYIRGEFERIGVSWRDISKMQKEVVSINLPAATDRRGRRVKTIEMTPAERIEFLCHASDQSTRNEMVKNSGMGIGFARNRGGEPVKLTAQDLRAIEASATETERAIAEAMKKYLNGDLRAALNEAWVDEFGYEIARRRDHWPRVRDAEFRARDADEAMRAWVDQFFADQGIFKPREGAREPVLIHDAFATFMAHVNKVSAYVGKSRASKDAMTLLGNPNFRRAVKSRFRHGAELLRDLEATVRSYAAIDHPRRGPIDRMVSWAMKRLHGAALKLKPQIMVYQPVSLLAATSEIDVKYLSQFWNWRGPVNRKVRAEVYQWCPYLRGRYEGTGVQILSAYAEGDSLRMFYTGKTGGTVAEFGMGGIRSMDQLAISIIWQACKTEGRAMGLTGDALMKHTAERAETVVRRTQPTWDELTISQIAREARDKPLYKILSLFASQRSKNVNITVRAISEYNHSDKTAADSARLARDVTVPLVVQSALVYAIRATWFAGLGMLWSAILGDDDKDKQDRSVADHAIGAARQVVGNWVFAGDLLNFIGKYAEGGLRGRNPLFGDDLSNPLFRGVELTAQAVSYGLTAARQAANDERYKSGTRKGSSKAFISASRATEAGLGAVGYMTGLPTEGLLQMFRPLLPHRRPPKSDPRRKQSREARAPKEPREPKQ